ncbi:MAG: 30S ribosomal protein S5 [Planctomycetes bacterium]|nr:30S ribosomal protein S5 [Planctomycetota bacterium]
MALHVEYLDHTEASALRLDEVVVKVNRSAAVVKGGRRFSFSALTVVGNRDGVVGFGFSKAKEVPSAVEKSGRDARKHLLRVPRSGTTIPHEVTGRFGSSSVKLIPAAPGTGIIAGSCVRAVLDLAGVKDVLTKAYGSTNAVNLVKAAVDAVSQLRTRERTEELRGVKVE